MTDPARVDFASGDTTIAAYRWDPTGEPTAIVQVTHGMGEHALRYGHLAATLTDLGYVVYAQDHRGHGRTAGSPEALGQVGADGWTELVQDIGRLTTVAREAHPGLPVVLLGHSMGSFATQQHLLDHSGDVDAVALTGTAVLDLLEPALDLDQPLDLAMFNAPFEPARTDYDWLSRDEAQVDLYVEDPLCGFGLDGDAGKQMFVAARALADPDRVGAIAARPAGLRRRRRARPGQRSARPLAGARRPLHRSRARRHLPGLARRPPRDPQRDQPRRGRGRPDRLDRRAPVVARSGVRS